MPRQPAKASEPVDVRRLLALVRRQRQLLRNEVIVLLSFKAGLRACEIAGLSWPMVLTSDHRVGVVLNITRGIAKGGHSRQLPIHQDLRVALRRLHAAQGRPRDGPVLPFERGGHLTPRGVVNWFRAAYAALGLVGCSSNSGRRTFITSAARVLAGTGGSLRDVQELAGHRALTTTERYIQGDRVSANYAAFVPGAKLVKGGVHRRVPHRSSP